MEKNTIASINTAEFILGERQRAEFLLIKHPLMRQCINKFVPSVAHLTLTAQSLFVGSQKACVICFRLGGAGQPAVCLCAEPDRFTWPRGGLSGPQVGEGPSLATCADGPRLNNPFTVADWDHCSAATVTESFLKRGASGLSEILRGRRTCPGSGSARA